MQPQLLATPHLKLYINARVAGFVVGMSYSIETPHRSLEAIDNISSQELAVATYKIRANFNVICPRSTLGLEGAGVAYSLNQLPLGKYLNIILLDKVTDKIVFQMEQAVVDSQNWQIQPKGLMSGQFSVTGIVGSSDVIGVS
jgi:hypothetical protein